jgi:eukaryotic-like serine/threonine-protein kinase
MSDTGDLEETVGAVALPTRRPDMLADRYLLDAQIGRGGTSVVWRAHDKLLDRDVAVKILSTGIDSRFDSAVQSEAKATARLTNTHVAHIYDYGEAERADGGRTPFLVMELVHGRSLADQLAHGQALPWPRAASIAAEIADALAAAHADGLVHRDIKPANVLLTGSGVKVIDFGISAIVGSPDVDDHGRIVGTPAYLAPERLIDVPVGAPADVYALGVLLYRCLAGTFPFEVDRRSEVLIAHLLSEPHDLPPISGLPADLADLCYECRAKTRTNGQPPPRSRSAPKPSPPGRCLALTTTTRRCDAA